jgi:hypothetical protein
MGSGSRESLSYRRACGPRAGARERFASEGRKESRTRLVNYRRAAWQDHGNQPGFDLFVAIG